jgi:hypothetical protein
MRSSAGLVGAGLSLVDEFFAPVFLEGWVANGTPLRHPDVEALAAAAATRLNGATTVPTPPTEEALRAGSAA